MNRSRPIRFFLTLLPIALFVTCVSGAEPWVEAAKRREATFHAVEIEYELVEFVARGSFPVMPLPGIDTKAPQPSEDQTIRSTNRIVLLGDKVRYENNQPVWDIRNKRYNPTQKISAYSENGSRMFYPNGMALNPKPDGFLLKESRAQGATIVYLDALFFSIRGQSTSVRSYLVAELIPTGGKSKVGQYACEEYVISGSDPSGRVVALDSAIGYLPRRIRRMQAGRVVGETIAEYVQDASGEWRPSTWTSTEYDKAGKVQLSRVVKIINFTRGINAPDESFEIVFPPGTIVHDERKEPVTYLVQPDGNWSEISLATGEVASSSISPVGSSWYRRNRGLFIGAVVAVCIVTAMAVVTRRRRRLQASDVK